MALTQQVLLRHLSLKQVCLGRQKEVLCDFALVVLKMHRICLHFAGVELL